MADNGFDGATATWDPTGASTEVTLGFISSITDDVTAAEVDVTGASDSQHLFEAGIGSESVTVEVVGQPTDESGGTQLAAGDNGALAVAWADSGTQGTIADPATIFALSISGTMDGPITSSITIRPGVT